MIGIKNINHLFTGIFLILVAFLAFMFSARLSTFTDVGLGSGFVPRMFASIQFLLGAALVASSFLASDDDLEEKEEWQFRPLLVLASIIFFGVSIERMGLVIAVTGLVLIASAANRGTRFYEALAVAIGSAAFSAIVFVKLLGLTVPIWPQNLWGG